MCCRMCSLEKPRTRPTSPFPLSSWPRQSSSDSATDEQNIYWAMVHKLHVFQYSAHDFQDCSDDRLQGR